MIKKDKIYELKIDEEDDISGIDSISLVDEPAIEVNWVAFKKDKPHDFHIPDGEDDIYLQKLMDTAQSEQELLEEGWVIHKVIESDKEEFAQTNPNEPSYEDTSFYRIRYKYGLSPNIAENAVIPTTRQFCRELVQKDYVWRVEDIDAVSNDFGQQAKFWRGGFNCRHKWFKIIYTRDSTIINKASVSRGQAQLNDLGIPTELTPDWTQSSTVTSKTAANPKPSTVRNLGLAKESFDKISLDYDGVLSTERGQQLALRLKGQGHKLYIVTNRNYTDALPVYTIADRIGIPRNNIYFTNGQPKWQRIVDLGIRRHYDSNPKTIKDIKDYTAGIQVEQFKSDMEIVAPNVNVFGYHTRYFQMCPLAEELFQHLITMEMDEDTQGMVRSAARAADNVFRIEGEVINAESATQHQYEEAVISVDDIKDIMNEVDKRIGMKHDVSFMDGHIKKIEEYLTEDMGYDVGGIGGYVDPGIKKKKKKVEMESYSDYPDSVKNNAKAVLKYVEENGWGSCGTEVGKIRANQLANGEAISLDTIKRMYSYLSRHEVDLESSKGYGDGCGKLMYDSWGGKSALSWAESKINQEEKMSKQYFAIDSEDKRIVIGPAMIPDLKIFRKDKQGNPYYVYFSSETIKMIAEKYMKNKYIDNNDEMHNGKAVSDVYVIESWIKEDEHDKSTKYGYESMPIGTWFVSMRIKNDETWKKVKEGHLNGFSVSGFFEEVADFCKEEIFLQRVANILKNIKE